MVVRTGSSLLYYFSVTVLAEESADGGGGVVVSCGGPDGTVGLRRADPLGCVVRVSTLPERTWVDE